MKKIRYLLALWLLFPFVHAHATDFMITRDQMLMAVRPFFPYPVVLGGWEILLSHPDLGFSPDEQAVTLKVLMDVRADAEKMQLAGQIRGQVFFDSPSQQLQLVKPTVESLQIISGGITGSKQTLDSLRQNIGRELPVIVLFDIKQLTGGMALIKLSRIQIANNGIIATF